MRVKSLVTPVPTLPSRSGQSQDAVLSRNPVPSPGLIDRDGGTGKGQTHQHEFQLETKRKGVVLSKRRRALVPFTSRTVAAGSPGGS
jgi:hypothetical protein